MRRLLIAGAGAVVALATLTGAVAAQGSEPTPARASGSSSAAVSSAVDASIRLSPLGTSTSLSPENIALDPSARAQQWRGVGAALSDASVEELRQYPTLITRLFSPSAAKGARLQWVRLPLSATDMSDRLWAWAFDGKQATPPAPARRALQTLGDIVEVKPRLRVVASAWTAPPSYKTSNAWGGGALRSDHVQRYARMLVAQAQWLLAHDVPLRAMTLINEPGHTSTYPTMSVSDEQLRALAAYVGPRLAKRGVQLWGLDHNWSDAPRLDGTTLDHLDAVAFHCYGGTPQAADGLTIPWLVDECTGTDDGFVGTFAYDSSTLIGDAVAHGSTGLILWNLVLPAGYQGGYGGCPNCRGLLTTSGSAVTAEPEFYSLAHLSRAAPVGSRSIAVSAPSGIDVAAFRSGNRIGVYGYNDSDATRSLRLDVAGHPVLTIGPRQIFSWTGRLG